MQALHGANLACRSSDQVRCGEHDVTRVIYSVDYPSVGPLQYFQAIHETGQDVVGSNLEGMSLRVRILCHCQRRNPKINFLHSFLSRHEIQTDGYIDYRLSIISHYLIH